MADHDQRRAFGGTDPLTRRLRDMAEGEHLVDAVVQRQRDPVARRLDLLDRREAGGPDGRHEGLVRGRDLRVRGDDIDARSPPGPRPPRSGAPRVDALAAPTGAGPRGMYALPPPMSGHERSRLSTRPPSSRTKNRGRQPDARRCSAQASDWKTCPPAASTTVASQSSSSAGVAARCAAQSAPPSVPAKAAAPVVPVRPWRQRDQRRRAPVAAS